MSAKLTRENITIIIVEAILTRSSMESVSKMTIIITVVTPIDMWGVPYFLLVLENIAGNKPSRLMAKGEREAAKMPALAAVRKASSAPTERVILPGKPIVAMAASESGSRGALPKVAGAMTPMETKTTTT